jgi:hypothetical protein
LAGEVRDSRALTGPKSLFLAEDDLARTSDEQSKKHEEAGHCTLRKRRCEPTPQVSTPRQRTKRNPRSGEQSHPTSERPVLCIVLLGKMDPVGLDR